MSYTKRSLIILISAIVLAALLGGSIAYLYLSRADVIQLPPAPTPIIISIPPTQPPLSLVASVSATPLGIPYCPLTDVKGSISFTGAAGSTYGNATLTNISASVCKILGNKYIQVSFDSKTITNLSIKPLGIPTAPSFTLNPSQSVSGRVRFPNGSQCSSPIRQINVLSTYEISPGTKIPFKDATGKQNFLINGCEAPTDKTTIEIFPLSETRK